MPAVDAQDLADRYINMWNDPDPESRRKTVLDLWAQDGEHILLPPQQMHDQAVALGFTTAALEARGHDELHARVTRAYEEFVAPGTFVFRLQETPRQVRDVVTFRWEAFQREEGQVTGGGRDFLVLDQAGRIRFDYQFPD
ncbi:hypothetical protein ABZ848_15745 [Streptomyces sp. NPDC047081]|uniref:hypothetical protein n=1 Tax=Streptomyces sp. NPDC047081 TaxID=3154706 RepID=UPI0033D2AB1A